MDDEADEAGEARVEEKSIIQVAHAKRLVPRTSAYLASKAIPPNIESIRRL